MKVLLLNPPGKRLYIRDYFCSMVAKGDYYTPPLDLLIQSGFLRDFEIKVIDAIAENLDDAECTRRIMDFSPDAIYFLTGSVSWEEDRQFMRPFNDRITVASGDNLDEKTLKDNPWLDAILTDFTDDSLVSFLRGRPANNMILRDKVTRMPGDFRIPVPRHELFMGNYRYPFMTRKPMTSVLTSYGCPYSCRFCIVQTLKHRERPLANVKKELEYVGKLGFRYIYFSDQTFSANRKRALLLCRELKKFSFEWCCFTRVDCVDPKLLSAMKESGCNTIMFGVESGDEAILKKYRKGYSHEDIRHAFALAKEHGIQTMGTFIIGLPEDTEETIESTIKLALGLGCDFASFNVAVPRKGTQLREMALEKGLAQEHEPMDQGGTYITMPTQTLGKETVAQLRARAVRKFYFRPRYMINRITKIKSITQLRTELSQAIALVKQKV
ncbi:MAG: radical SAM protein [archaeon]